MDVIRRFYRLFRTLAYANKLKAVGVPTQQAEVQAEALAETIESNLATKRDMNELKRDMKELETALTRDMKELETSLTRDIEELRLATKRDIEELKRDIKELELTLTIRVGGMLTVAVGILAVLMKLL